MHEYCRVHCLFICLLFLCFAILRLNVIWGFKGSFSIEAYLSVMGSAGWVTFVLVHRNDVKYWQIPARVFSYSSFHLSLHADASIMIMKVSSVHLWKHQSASAHQYDECQIDSQWFSAQSDEWTGFHNGNSIKLMSHTESLPGFLLDCVNVHTFTPRSKKMNKEKRQRREQSNVFLSFSLSILLSPLPFSSYTSAIPPSLSLRLSPNANGVERAYL